MLRITGNHTIEEYLDVLSSSLDIYIDYERLRSAYDDSRNSCDDYRWLTLMWLRIESGGEFYTVSADNIIDYLVSRGVDMERYRTKKTGRISLDQKRVINPLIERGIAVDVLSSYKEFRSAESRTGLLRGLVQQNKVAYFDKDGRSIMKFETHVEQQENMRAYYNNIPVVSIPKMYSNIVTGPSEQHYLAWCDYPQADWRFAYNLFIRNEANFKVMSECNDAYEGLARLVEGEAFDAEAFKENRKIFKVNALSTFYNSMNPDPIPTAIRKFFHSCPRYAKLFFDLGVFYQFHMPIPCTSYFGFEQRLPEAYKAGDFISKGMNTPIQTFTAHVVNETVLGVLQKFWDLGYTKDEINVYYVRHDEPIFSFKPTIIKDAWIFKECSEIYIPGFTPIHLDFHFGRYYQEEDEQITAEINRHIAGSNHEYEVFSDADFADDIHNDYSPVPSVESIYAQCVTDQATGAITVRMYNYRDFSRKLFETPVANDPDEALHYALENGALKWLGEPAYLLIKCPGLDFSDYVGKDEETLIRVQDKYDSSAAGGF